MLWSKFSVFTDQKGRDLMNSAADVWQKVLSLMGEEMTSITLNTWFDDAEAIALEGSRFVLYSPVEFKRNNIISRYVPAIQKALRELFSFDFEVEILETTPIEYRCYCSRSRVEAALLSLGKTELESLIAEQGQCDITCQFCDKVHHFSKSDLTGLLINAQKK